MRDETGENMKRGGKGDGERRKEEGGGGGATMEEGKREGEKGKGGDEMGVGDG